MHTSNWRPTQGAGGAVGDSSMETADWRSQLTADLRQRIANKIMDTLIRHPEQLKQIAVKIEEHIYTTATSQSDYIRKISMRTSAAEARPQYPIPNAMQSNSAVNSTHLHEIGGVVGDSSIENGDWRAHLHADSRQRIVNKIFDTLIRHLPQYGSEFLKNLAAECEEKTFTVATSQSDYLRKISLKMLMVETRSPYLMPHTMRLNSANNSINPSGSV
ncbi:uncharacterized protein [Rutidosis leptorrhynchoides]|uniref:uncharacterized protein n=1 Tax=Rutidosis leptorrhynchoides TaxID=125765 RepID=UPI003A9A333E